MRKADKKIENKLRIKLIEICELLKEDFTDYQWVTHTVNYNDFPNSLQISCAFSSQQSIKSLNESNQALELKKIISQGLLDIDIKMANINKQIKLIVA